MSRAPRRTGCLRHGAVLGRLLDTRRIWRTICQGVRVSHRDHNTGCVPELPGSQSPTGVDTEKRSTHAIISPTNFFLVGSPAGNSRRHVNSLPREVASGFSSACL